MTKETNWFSKPINQQMEVLAYLLAKDNATTKDIQRDCHVLNVTAKISELRKYGVNISCSQVKAKNKYGRQINFGMYKICNLAESKIIYKRKNKKS
jgi:hypothetical protein